MAKRTRDVLLAGAVVAAVAGCGGGSGDGASAGGVSSGAPAGSSATAESAGSTPSSAASEPVQLAQACDALEPDQVARALGGGQVTETVAGTSVGTITGCFYQVGAAIPLQTSAATGYVGDPADFVSDPPAGLPGPGEPVPDLGTAAAYFTDGTTGGIVIAYDAGEREVLTFSVSGELPREQLVAVAREADATITG